MSGQNLDNEIKVAIARGIHLFPFRTEKLSLVTPMVLRNSGRVGSRRLEARRKPEERGVSPKGLTPFSVIYTSRLIFNDVCLLLLASIYNSHLDVT